MNFFRSEPFRDSPRSANNAGDHAPLSTPALAADAVYAISARGQLVCLGVDDGKLRWKHDLNWKFGAAEPHYGFATSPLLVDDTLVVLTGGRGIFAGKSVVAFDRHTGTPRWKAARGSTEYSSAALMTVDGVQQVIVQAERNIFALDLADGEELWSVPVEDGGSWTPLVLPDQRIFCSVSSGLMLKIARRDGGFFADTLWTSTKLGGTISPVAFVDGCLYGADNRWLTCVDASDGSTRWIERRDVFPIRIDDAIWCLADREGKLLVIRPDCSRYDLVAEIDVYEAQGATRVESPMAYANDTLYVRTEFAIIAMRRAE